MKNKSTNCQKAQNKNDKIYLEKLGGLLVNISSLEFLLRVCLLRHEGKEQGKFALNKVKVGERVEKNSFTGRDTLGTVIEKFNRIFKNQHGVNKLQNLNKIRNVITHSRIFPDNPNTPLIIIKFNSSMNRRFVDVEAIQELNEKWLNEELKLVRLEIKRLSDFYENLGK